MSNNNDEPIYVRYNKRRNKYYCERFGTPLYNSAQVFLEWDTSEEAYDWARSNLNYLNAEICIVV